MSADKGHVRCGFETESGLRITMEIDLATCADFSAALDQLVKMAVKIVLEANAGDLEAADAVIRAITQRLSDAEDAQGQIRVEVLWGEESGVRG